jgi:hypothetical protein
MSWELFRGQNHVPCYICLRPIIEAMGRSKVGRQLFSRIKSYSRSYREVEDAIKAEAKSGLMHGSTIQQN